ncbi:hypothetical protein F7234_19450 [Pseudomonas putida]|uniref:hypothetical protein n=1 Tax=Pseudomonas putida TaxID=303 RepID=UPI00125F4E8E|nr:hypothetical protein [Pseudomonas putida]KAB5620547.1 hypothetical protein F7234_19450 [Pseudomonas putida]
MSDLFKPDEIGGPGLFGTVRMGRPIHYRALIFTCTYKHMQLNCQVIETGGSRGSGDGLEASWFKALRREEKSGEGFAEEFRQQWLCATLGHSVTGRAVCGRYRVTVLQGF